MAKKKHKPDITALTPDQIKFIQERVMRLGSMEAVSEAYNRDDSVCLYAKTFAEAWYNRERTLS